jgi:hypothetical protein
MYVNCKAELYGAHLFLFCDWARERYFNWGVHNVAKKLIMYGSFKTKINKCWECTQCFPVLTFFFHVVNGSPFITNFSCHSHGIK